MTPNGALTAVIGRLNAGGFVESRSPNGLTDGGTQRLEKGFAVKPTGITFDPSRGASRTAGARVTMGFNVQIGHIIKPNDGQTAPVTALTDVHTALKYLFAPGTALTGGGQGSVLVGGVTVNYLDGYLIQNVALRVTFALDLTP